MPIRCGDVNETNIRSMYGTRQKSIKLVRGNSPYVGNQPLLQSALELLRSLNFTLEPLKPFGIHRPHVDLGLMDRAAPRASQRPMFEAGATWDNTLHRHAGTWDTADAVRRGWGWDI